MNIRKQYFEISRFSDANAKLKVVSGFYLCDHNWCIMVD